jgi:ribosome-binding factor A
LAAEIRVRGRELPTQSRLAIIDAERFDEMLAAEIDRTQEALDHSAHFIRGLVKKRFRLKTIPDFVFRYDPTIQESIHIHETLERLKSPPPPP